jgi:imidazoleglycerol-phosphate dehydratase
MRQFSLTRITNETQIELSLTIDGSGQSRISTGVGFLDHMLHLFAVHGLFDLTVAATGDIYVDFHHTVEDIGICLGLAFREALGNSKGIRRYASKLIPMDEALTQVALDLSNRIYFSFEPALPKAKIGEFDAELVEEFWHAFVTNARINAHIKTLSGTNLHHIAESIFKAMAIALDEATQIDTRKTQVPSTKGVL